MNIIDHLTTQHEIFLDQLNYLERLKAEKELYDIEGLKEVASLIIHTIEKHAELEEKILFPEIGKFSLKENSPFRVMQFEHHEEMGKVKQLLENAKEPYQVRVEIQKLIEFFKDHIAKEEEVVFPLVRNMLSETRLEELLGPLKKMEGYL